MYSTATYFMPIFMSQILITLASGTFVFPRFQYTFFFRNEREREREKLL